ncbi:hypothetical protein AMATHDRAFT_68638 [Amanita thiersii Skay4041]|uniref:Uncharacterized protein n=1 Tax=Amanita thiersii Skay4041 TaxID=703135 RepID=A0A2A9NCC0_9AGAR|nr:hypothetical protein AMATHDRAFT_68638 [Amanita thiersii Skay4041]
MYNLKRLEVYIPWCCWELVIILLLGVWFLRKTFLLRQTFGDICKIPASEVTGSLRGMLLFSDPKVKDHDLRVYGEKNRYIGVYDEVTSDNLRTVFLRFLLGP